MRYAIVSDVHANHVALRAVEDHIRNIEGQELPFWFLGDLVGYGPVRQVLDCVRWLKNKSKVDAFRWVAGNHDEWIINGNGQVNRNARVTLSAQQLRLEQSAAEEEESDEPVWAWFRKQVGFKIQTLQHAETFTEPNSLTFVREGGLVCALTHGGTGETDRRGLYLYPWLPDLLINGHNHLFTHASTQDADCVCLLYGHTHFPVLAEVIDQQIVYQPIRYGRPYRFSANHFIVNPGSVGQPRDGDPRAAYAILDTEQNTIEFRRVEYDIRRVVTDLYEESNCSSEPEAYTNPDGLVKILQTGNGGISLIQYREKVYRPPEFDLIPVNSSLD